MEAEARYSLVGGALIALVIALIGAVVWLKRSGLERDSQRYTVVFLKQTLEGLQIGGDVTLRGIKVGRVEDFRLSERRINGVRVTVRVMRDVPVRDNTVAFITRNIVTNIAQVVLVTPEPPGPPIGEPPSGEPYPVIAEGRSDMDEITGKVTQIGEQASEALININRLLSPENREAIGQTLANLRDLTGNINQRLIALDTTLNRVGTAASEVSRASDRIATTIESAGGGLQDTFASAQQTLAEAQRAVAEVTRAASALRTDANGMLGQVNSTAQAFDAQLLATVNELRVTLDAATRTLDSLRDPRSALLGPGKAHLGPGERLP